MTKIAQSPYYEAAVKQLDCPLPDTASIKLLQDLYGQTYVETASCPNTVALAQLIDFEFVELSHDMHTISMKGQELVETAAELWGAAENAHNIPKKRGSAKREISDEMNSYVERTFELLEGHIETRPDISEDRSNLFVHFIKSKRGIGCIEIKNKPELRVSVRKTTQETIDLFTSIGMTYRSTPNVTYFDIPRSMENLELLINTVLKYINA